MRITRTLSLVMILVLLLSCIPMSVAQAYSMPYYIDVDLSNNIVTIYSSDNDEVVRQMICSSGKAGTPSPTGTFFMPEKYKQMERTEWYVFEDGYGKYGSRIWGNYLFHSYLFYEDDESTVKQETYAGLGSSASHGCIRLFIEDAKWIADNCLPGTKVTLYYNTERLDYIKELIYCETYSIDSGITYDQFISRAVLPGDIGYSSEGEEVASLQLRLRELGLYDGEVDGYYGAQMVSTIKSLQKLLGYEITGIVNADLISIINSEACPTGLLCTLSKGMQGNTVITLQNILISLGLYEGTPSGIFDTNTENAIMAFQAMIGYSTDGIATPDLQNEMLSFAYNLSCDYGEYGAELIYEAQLHTNAVITVEERLNVRAADGTIIDSLENGTIVEYIRSDGDWSYIRYDNTEGYVSTSYLTITESTSYIPKYIAASCAENALPPFSLNSIVETETNAYGTIAINSRLHFRAEPNTESELVFILSPGTKCRIISEDENGWVYVKYGNNYGYAMAKYFDIEYITELTGSYISSK